MFMLYGISQYYLFLLYFQIIIVTIQNDPVMNKEKVYVFDTTLRDGAQTEGISFSADDKIKIARRLDSLGVHYIEGGFSAPTNRTDMEFF